MKMELDLLRNELEIKDISKGNAEKAYIELLKDYQQSQNNKVSQFAQLK